MTTSQRQPADVVVEWDGGAEVAARFVLAAVIVSGAVALVAAAGNTGHGATPAGLFEVLRDNVGVLGVVLMVAAGIHYGDALRRFGDRYQTGVRVEFYDDGVVLVTHRLLRDPKTYRWRWDQMSEVEVVRPWGWGPWCVRLRADGLPGPRWVPFDDDPARLIGWLDTRDDGR